MDGSKWRQLAANHSDLRKAVDITNPAKVIWLQLAIRLPIEQLLPEFPDLLYQICRNLSACRKCLLFLTKPDIRFCYFPDLFQML